MPGLQSFCVCTALGLASIYLLQVGWFVAWLAVDEERIRAAKNGFVPCVRHKNRTELEDEAEHKTIRQCVRHRTEDEAEHKTIRQCVIGWYRTLLSCTVYRVVIVMTSLCCLACGVWGSSLIRHKFDPFLLLPADSYLSQFIAVNDQYYNPYRGWSAEIYTGGINHTDLAKIDNIISELEILKQKKILLQGM